MFGNLINNRQLKQLIKENAIYIEPFEEQSVKSTHYTLHPGRVFRRNSSGVWKQAHDFKSSSNSFQLSENEYVVVEIRQVVKILIEGIVGRFIPTSSLIENGLMVLAGQIDNKYGVQGEGLRFGVKNLLQSTNELSIRTRLVHVEFFDMRGLAFDPVNLTAEEVTIRERRRMIADADGVFYEDNSDL